MFESNNLKKLLGEIGNGAQDKMKESLNDSAMRSEIDEGMFQSALLGIRRGEMLYENDPLLPIVSEEINSRTQAYTSLSAEEESNMLQLNAEQKKIISGADKAQKAEFLKTAPKLGNAGVKLNPKFLNFVNNVSKAD